MRLCTDRARDVPALTTRVTGTVRAGGRGTRVPSVHLRPEGKQVRRGTSPCRTGPASPQVAARSPLGCDDTGPALEGCSIGRQKRPLTPRSGCFPASARGPRSACRSSCRPGGYRAETRRGDRQGRNSTSLTAFEMTAMGMGTGTTSGGRHELRRTACPATAPPPRRARRWRCRTPRSRSRPRSSTAASAARRARAARARRPAASPRTGSW